jgi:hypothetical protein
LPAPRKLEYLRAVKLNDFRDIGTDCKRTFAPADDCPGKFGRFRKSPHLVRQRIHYRAFQARISVIAFQCEKDYVLARGRNQASAHCRVRLRAVWRQRADG